MANSEDISIEFWDGPKCIAQADQISAFLKPLFEEDNWSDYGAKLSRRRSLFAVVAVTANGNIAGLKMGYERNQNVFNSSIGAVDPAYRGRGLANRLMVAQHAWAREAGFRGMETATRQPNRAMGIINLKHGFVVAGLDVVPGSETKVVFYKDLSAQDS
jgi:GNAT superfamily N-acetyltransferase